MMSNLRPRLRLALLVVIPILLAIPAAAQEAAGPPSASAIQEPDRDGVWVEAQAEDGTITRTMRLTLHPAAEPVPALKYRFLPSEADMLEGNAAVHYIKAMGFLEQNAARDRLSDVYAETFERARQENRDYSELPPHVWQSTRPEDLPVDEVVEFLRLTSFQRWSLREAARIRHADFDRQLATVEDIWGYLIPEIQTMRELARMQRLRCRVAIARGDVDEALAILGEQYGMARHLGQDGFLVSALVGVACGGIAWEDALHLIRHPEAPNLYWAFASLPHPLIDLRKSLDGEYDWLTIQLEPMREVDETPRTAGYWQDFIDRLIPELGSLESELAEEFGGYLPDDPVEARAVVAGMIAAAYPGAKRYLVERGVLKADQIDSYPTAQIVFLAMMRYHAEYQQERLKWTHLPYWQAKDQMRASVERTRASEVMVGWAGLPTQWTGIGPAATGSVARLEQQIALIQTIEAIRMYGASHDGALPDSLSILPVPAPVDPMTGQPFEYRHQGAYAVLVSASSQPVQYRFVLRFSDPVVAAPAD